MGVNVPTGAFPPQALRTTAIKTKRAMDLGCTDLLRNKNGRIIHVDWRQSLNKKTVLAARSFSGSGVLIWT
jgi:hypothetical protein